jgi:hypothetical protein
MPTDGSGVGVLLGAAFVLGAGLGAGLCVGWFSASFCGVRRRRGAEVGSALGSTRVRRRRGVGVGSALGSTRVRRRRRVGSALGSTCSRSLTVELGCVSVVRLRLRFRVGRSDCVGADVVGATLGIGAGERLGTMLLLLGEVVSDSPVELVPLPLVGAGMFSGGVDPVEGIFSTDGAGAGVTAI